MTGSAQIVDAVQMALNKYSSRSINTLISANYDDVPYDPVLNPALEPQRIFGLGALYGCETATDDVLDLGCGTGTQLEYVGERVAGRLVGIDLSTVACQQARSRCAKFGERARILCSDFLDLKPSDLGQFDLIYNVGVIFVTPPDVQRHILDLIGECLRPGGVAVISYYAGALPQLRAGLHRTLRAVINPKARPGEAVSEARQRIREIAYAVKHLAPADGLFNRALIQSSELSDTMFFHEVLNHTFDAMHTTEIDAHLTKHGVGFLILLPARGFGVLPTSKQRALASDATDFVMGGYHHAVFGRWLNERQSADVRSPAVRWQSNVCRKSGELNYNAPAKFSHISLQGDVNIPGGLPQAFFDELAAGPASWQPAIDGAAKRLEAKGLRVFKQQEADLAEAVLMLWSKGVLVPLRNIGTI